MPSRSETEIDSKTMIQNCSVVFFVPCPISLLLRYHVERNVCGVKKPSNSLTERNATVPKIRRLRKAAVQAASLLSAAAAAAASSINISEESLDEDFDGKPEKRRRANHEHTKPGRKSGGSKIQQDLEQDLEPGARGMKEEALRDGENEAKPSWRGIPGLLPRWVSRRGGDAEDGGRTRVTWEVGDVSRTNI